MEIIRSLLLLLRVDNFNFLVTLGLALLIHYSGIIWQPLSSHRPDLSSGIYICSVLIFLMRPLCQGSVQPTSSYLWVSLCIDSMKMLLALLLLQHVALLCLWDPCSWMLYYTLFSLAPKFRLGLAFFLLCFSGFKVLKTCLQLTYIDGDLDIDFDNDGNGDTDYDDYIYNESVAYINQCPFCAQQQMKLLEQQQQFQLEIEDDTISAPGLLKNELQVSSFAQAQAALREHSYVER